MRSRTAAATMTVVVAMMMTAPVRGQTIVDTFRQLKSTARQLAGKPSPTPPSQQRDDPAADSANRGSADDGLVVPASVMVDDASDTSLATAPVVPRRVETFDIRGFKLGMSPREVGRIGDRERFRRRWNDLFLTSGTFELEAARLANQQLGRPIEKSSKVQLKASEGLDPDGNVIKLEFTLQPEGPRLSRITYTAKLNGTTPERTAQALIAKYGTPVSNERGTGYLAWANSSRPVDLATAELSAVVSTNGMTLTLSQSVDYEQAANRKLSDRASQLAAARGGGVRF